MTCSRRLRVKYGLNRLASERNSFRDTYNVAHISTLCGLQHFFVCRQDHHMVLYCIACGLAEGEETSLSFLDARDKRDYINDTPDYPQCLHKRRTHNAERGVPTLHLQHGQCKVLNRIFKWAPVREVTKYAEVMTGASLQRTTLCPGNPQTLLRAHPPNSLSAMSPPGMSLG